MYYYRFYYRSCADWGIPFAINWYTSNITKYWVVDLTFFCFTFEISRCYQEGD